MPDKSLKGIYVLLIELSQNTTIRVGKLGEIFFPHGFYAYVGSAMGGIKQRVSRHLRKVKVIHWHIDYLTAEAQIRDVLTLETDQRLECILAGKLAVKFSSIPGFGTSDCRCESHLFFASDCAKLKPAVTEAIQSLGTGRETSSTTEVSI